MSQNVMRDGLIAERRAWVIELKEDDYRAGNPGRGVERLLPVEVRADPARAAVLELEHVGDLPLEADAAGAAAGADVRDRDHLLAEVEGLGYLYADVPGGVPVGPVGAHLGQSPVDALRPLKAHRDLRDPLDLRMRLVEPGIEVAAVPGVQRAPDLLDELLRHRPLL